MSNETVKQNENNIRHPADHDKAAPGGKGKKDHAAWLSWLIITIGLLLFTLYGDNPNILLSLVLTGLSAAYTYYIFKGGRYVFVFTLVELIAKLFTLGYTKTLKPDQEKSKAWIAWAAFIVLAIIFTFIFKAVSMPFGIAVIIMAGLYTYYLYNGGRIVYIPLILGLLIFSMLTTVVNIVPFAVSNVFSVTKTEDIECEDYLSMADTKKTEIAEKLAEAKNKFDSVPDFTAIVVKRIENFCYNYPISKIGSVDTSY